MKIRAISLETALFCAGVTFPLKLMSMHLIAHLAFSSTQLTSHPFHRTPQFRFKLPWTWTTLLMSALESQSTLTFNLR